MRKEERVRIETAGLIAAAVVLTITIMAGIAVFLTTINGAVTITVLVCGCCAAPLFAALIRNILTIRALGR